MNPIRPTVLAVAALLAGLPATAGAPALAATPAASAWTLSQDGGDRQCRLTLRAPARGGAAVAMPYGCRRAFPSLSRVVAWSKAGDGLRFADDRGDTLLAFEADGAGYRTTTPQGEALALKPADAGARAALDAAAADGKPAAVELAQASAKSAPRKAAAGPKPAEVAGRYAVLRDKTRDTGCMVTLDDKAAGPGSTLKARLAPACRDQGIVIFDPVGWQMVGGKLVLTARKGHTTELESQDDGSWRNEPKAGKTLGLKRI